jgi:hypothetical protein
VSSTSFSSRLRFRIGRSSSSVAMAVSVVPSDEYNTR